MTIVYSKKPNISIDIVYVPLPVHQVTTRFQIKLVSTYSDVKQSPTSQLKYLIKIKDPKLLFWGYIFQGGHHFMLFLNENGKLSFD